MAREYSFGFCIISAWLALTACGMATDGEDESASPPDTNRESLVGQTTSALTDRADWTRIGDDITDMPRTLVIDRWLPGVMYTEASTVLSSRSFGERWRAADVGLDHAAVDPNRPGVAYATGELVTPPDELPLARLFVTYNAGVTWQETSQTSARLLAIAPGSSRIRWGTTVSGLFRSTDGGTTWEPMGDGPYPCCDDLVAVSESEVYVGGSYSYLYHSRDGGETWTTTTGGLLEVETFAVDLRRPDVVYIGSSYTPQYVHWAGLRKSVDGGQTWTEPSAPTVAYVTEVAVSPVDGRVYVRGRSDQTQDYQIQVSTDGAETFVPAGRGLEGVTVAEIVPHPRTRCLVYALTNAGLYRSFNGGGTCR